MSLFYFNEKSSNSASQIGQTKNSVNLQNIPLLESSFGYESSAIGGGDIIIINNDSLLAETGPLGTLADIEETKTNGGQINIYVVRDGDSLSQIAKIFNVSVNTIIWANDIKKASIQPGQTLVILPISGIKYEIKKGDTLKDIAKKNNGNIDEIMEFNNIYSDKQLIAGETIIIPNGEMETQTPTSKQKNPYRGGTGHYYAGYYLRPISGGYKSQGLHGYNGVDLAESCGSPIIASAGGDVIISRSGGWNGGYGNYVVISHPNETQTLYSHMLYNVVSVGWHVAQGQIIGYIGSTGNSTGCHVHFEIRGAKNPF